MRSRIRMILSKSSGLGFLPEFTMENRFTPSAWSEAAWAKISSSGSSPWTSHSVWWKPDWAQNRQFSEHFPLMPLMMVQRSTFSPTKAFRILSAPSRRAPRSSVTKNDRSSSAPSRLPAMISSARPGTFIMLPPEIEYLHRPRPFLRRGGSRHTAPVLPGVRVPADSNRRPYHCSCPPI